MISYNVKKCISLWVMLICMFSAALTGTLAWQDLTQHKSNEFKGITYTERAGAALVKLDKETEEPLEGAKFELYLTVPGGDDQRIGGEYITNANGRIIVEGLEEGEYYWLETEPGYGWTFDRDTNDNEIKKYPFTVETNSDGVLMPVVCKAYNQRLYADITIYKRVENLTFDRKGSTEDEQVYTEPEPSPAPDPVPEPAPAPMPDPIPGPDDEITNESEGEPTVVTTMPAYSEFETTAFEPASILPETQSNSLAPLAETEIEATENKSNENDSPVARFEFTVTLKGLEDSLPILLIDGTAVRVAGISEGKLIFELEDGQTAVIKGLPVGAQYTVAEKPASGYIGVPGFENGILPPEGAEVNWVNYFSDEIPGKLIVKKLVTGVDADLDKEFRFTVTIDGEDSIFTLKNGEDREFILPPGVSFEVKEDDYSNEGYMPFENIEHHSDDGTAVIEYTQINHYTGPVEVDIEGEKTWDTAGTDIQLPVSITVHLKDGDTIVETATVVPGADGKWRYSFTAPKYRDDGVTEILYTVEEVPVPGFNAIVTGYNIHNAWIPPETVIVPSVKKLISGNPKTNVQFGFRLTAQDNAPMPPSSAGTVKTIYITGAGEASFGQIQYTKPGTYRYTISEIVESRTGWTYDRTIYILTVTTKIQNGSLIAAKVLTKAGGAAAGDKAVFTNSYHDKPNVPDKPNDPGNPGKPGITDIPKTGDNSNLWLWAISMITSAVALRMLLLYRKPERTR